MVRKIIQPKSEGKIRQMFNHLERKQKKSEFSDQDFMKKSKWWFNVA